MEVQSICEIKLSTVSVVLQPLFPYACYFTSSWDPAENKFKYLLFLFALYNCPGWQKHVVVVIFLFFSIVEYTVPERLVSPTGNENKLPGLGSIFGLYLWIMLFPTNPGLALSRYMFYHLKWWLVQTGTVTYFWNIQTVHWIIHGWCCAYIKLKASSKAVHFHQYGPFKGHLAFRIWVLASFTWHAGFF